MRKLRKFWETKTGTRLSKTVVNSIWVAFLKTEAAEFTKQMGYGPKEIHKIGIRKFVDANGWFLTQHVSRWRTDAWRVVVCPECGKDFGILSDDMGLCPKCLPRFDLNKYFGEIHKIVDEDKPELMGAAIGKAMVVFMGDPETRARYRKIS